MGGGIGSLAAAAFMIRDGNLPGENISILEASPTMGGSLDGAGHADSGYSMRGGRMLTTDNYECTWDLFKSIPSLVNAGGTVFQETEEFNEAYRTNSMARLVDKRRARIPVGSMGFSMQDRVELLKLSQADESTLAASCITDWLSPAFFETEFWFMWATTFAFQPWHSAVEFKRYLLRFLFWCFRALRLWPVSSGLSITSTILLSCPYREMADRPGCPVGDGLQSDRPRPQDRGRRVRRDRPSLCGARPERGNCCR